MKSNVLGVGRCLLSGSGVSGKRGEDGRSEVVALYVGVSVTNAFMILKSLCTSPRWSSSQPSLILEV